VATNAYETVTGFKKWVALGVNDQVDDMSIDSALDAASRGIDYYCGTQFWQTAAGVARVFDTWDPYLLRVGAAVAVTQVATDPDRDGTYDTVWAGTDFQLLPLNPPAGEPFSGIYAIGTLTFPTPTRRVGLVRVTGTWGWPTIPSGVVQATRLIANRLIKRRSSPEGIVGFDDFGTARISRSEDPDAVRLLTPFRANRRAGGWAFA
jgi:hypothetical protein